jgi:hypothetical protein
VGESLTLKLKYFVIIYFILFRVLVALPQSPDSRYNINEGTVLYNVYLK